jgi:hypothetical protein
MKNIFLFIFLNLTGIITYKIINNKINKNTSLTNFQTDLSSNSIISQYDISHNHFITPSSSSCNSVSTQTDLSNIDMLILLEYKKALENIYDDNQKYEWKFV